jgi:hypothetical protein
MPPPPPPQPNFDFPPASDTSRSISEFREEYSRIRQTLNQDRDLINANREAARERRRQTIRELRENNFRLAGVRGALDTMSSVYARRRRRLSNDDASNTDSSNPSARRLPIPRPPSSRRHLSTLHESLDAASGNPAGPLLAAYRARDAGPGPFQSRIRSRVDNLHRMAMFRQQREANSNNTQGSGPESESDLTALRRQPKRRKLIHDADVSAYDPVIYGWNGQVDPGNLRLEIFSCDGGEHIRTQLTSYRPMEYRVENVLKNDKSVYCSESHKCNILFRHQAESLFHLESLVIKAPEHGFTAPIQQGLVFVGMSAEELLNGSKSYRMAYPKHGAARNFSFSFETRNASTLNLSQTPPMEDDASSRTWRLENQPDVQPSEPEPIDIDTDSTDDEDRPPGQSQRDRTVPDIHPALSVPTPPANIGNESDESSDVEWPLSSSRSDPHLRLDEIRELIQLIRDTSPADANSADLLRLNNQFEELVHSMYPSRPMRRATPARVEVRDFAGSGSIREANASFFIPKTESGITINFDPPV